MFSKFSRVMLSITVVLSLLLIAVIWRSVSLRTDNRRLEGNQRALMAENRRYAVRDSLSAVSTGVLTMRIAEFRDYFDELNSMVRDLNIKVKRLESVSRHATESRYEISAAVRDTLLHLPGAITASHSTQPVQKAVEHSEDDLAINDSSGAFVTVPLSETGGRYAKYIEYDSDYLKMEGVVTDSAFQGTVMTFDTLTQVVHRVPRRFLFIKWGTKELRQEIISSNPHTTVVYSEHIRITR